VEDAGTLVLHPWTHIQTESLAASASAASTLPTLNVALSGANGVAVTEAAIEFGFTGPRVLHDGALLRLENRGWLVHMISLIGVRNAASGRKVMALLRAGKDGRAQKLATASSICSGPPRRERFSRRSFRPRLAITSRPASWTPGITERTRSSGWSGWSRSSSDELGTRPRSLGAA
jgi:hypothetical protein